MIALKADIFEAEVLNSDLPVVLDFWGPQCGPCLALMPDIEALAEEYAGRIKFCKVNVAENRRLCITLKVMGVPSFLFYRKGECLERVVGDAVSLDAVKAAAAKLLA